MDAAACIDRLRRLAQLVDTYRWLLDSYVIEFFTESHWSKFPQLWQVGLNSVDLPELSRVLLGNGEESNAPLTKVYPLSLLALSAAAHYLSLPRQPPDTPSHGQGVWSQLEGLEHVFRCHVKPKKQHEIRVFGEMIHQLSLKTSCKNVIDVGSGQGHLARYLAHRYGLSVTGVEGVGSHLTTAAKYDRDVKKLLAKRAARANPSLHSNVSDGTLKHIEAVVQPDASIEDIFSLLSSQQDSHFVKKQENKTTVLSSDSQSPELLSTSCDTRHNITSTVHKSHDSQYILIGLHTCGDLAPTILRAFAKSKRVVGVASVGCCYMKLSCEGGVVCGYPLSESGQSLGCGLSYEAREVACHSIEMYRERLQGSLKSFDHLKVHCHRAAVEILLRKRGLRRGQIRISKRVSKLSFKEYTHALLHSLSPTLTTPIPPPTDAELDDLVQLVDGQWQRVVVYFMLRLVLAPCVESILLLDRALYLYEQGYQDVTLTALFDPSLSPRNHVIMAT